MFDINREHPEYAAKKATWKKYHDLYAGGEQLKNNASTYLIRRQKEPTDVYLERLNKVFYENYVGSIIDWYAATLFRREPILSIAGPNERGRQFFAEFAGDCDLKGTKLSDFFRRRFLNAMVDGTSHILVDFPRLRQPAGNRAEEEAAGGARAYLVGYMAEDLINWSHDERGNYDWVVLRTSSLKKAKVEDPDWVEETTWLYYDKHEFRVYRQRQQTGGASQVEIIDGGFHAFSKQGRVPLFSFQLAEGMWLMNKAGLLQLEHFNKSNALSWALTMGLFAMPVIYSERDWNQIVGESYYIQLGPGDRFGWTEPEGKVFQIATDNLARLQEEIYRVCYLTHLGVGGRGRRLGGNPWQSGLSKQRDFSITQEILRSYGDGVKDVLMRIMLAIEAAREDGLMIDVSGMDEFDIGDFSSELQDAEGLLLIGIDSQTLRKQVYKKLAFQYLCDVRQETKDQIGREIDDGFKGQEHP